MRLGRRRVLLEIAVELAERRAVQARAFRALSRFNRINQSRISPASAASSSYNHSCVPVARHTLTALLCIARCTADDAPGLCEHTSKWDEPLPPVVSAKLTTKDKFSFRYGTAEIRLRVPIGDWIWPAVWLLPAESDYGPWPLSGEIDLLEARGNNESYRVEGSDQAGFW